MRENHEYQVNFVCPHCVSDSGINEEEWCLVGNQVQSFEVNSWEEDPNEVVLDVFDAEIIGYGLPDIKREIDCPEVRWVCKSCGEEISEDIKLPSDLFNWLHENKMLRLVDIEKRNKV